MNNTWVASWWSESGWACATSQPQASTGATVFGIYLAHVTLFPSWHLSQSKSEASADDDRVAAHAPDTLPKGASVAALASHPFVATWASPLNGIRTRTSWVATTSSAQVKLERVDEQFGSPPIPHTGPHVIPPPAPTSQPL